MDEIISAAEANREFSRLMRGVRQGRSYLVTSHGKPVARIVPADHHPEAATRARRALLARLERQPVVQAQPWTRDELYTNDE